MPLWLALLLISAGAVSFVAGIRLREADRPIRYTLEWGFLTNSRPLGRVLGLVGVGIITATAVLVAKDLFGA